jgi:phospholipid/cholesterol/gamma-HCH transport system ATP-binding protein
VGALPGSGKTALLETAAGLRPAVVGETRLFGRPLGSLSPPEVAAARRRIGFLYDDGGRLLGHLTLAQNVALPLCYHRNSTDARVADEVERWLKAAGLGVMAHRQPGQVNAAWRQRAALVRALVLEPDILYLDDPLAPLNTTHTRWWLDFLDPASPANPGLRRPGTIVVATDDLRPWLAVANRFALIQEGRWRVLGAREELAAAGEPLLRELLAESEARR